MSICKVNRQSLKFSSLGLLTGVDIIVSVGSRPKIYGAIVVAARPVSVSVFVAGCVCAASQSVRFGLKREEKGKEEKKREERHHKY